jgi:YesN/AraC family two-component response regulator
VDDLILYIHASDKARVQETLRVIMEPFYNLPYMHMGAIQTMRVQIAAMVMHIFNELNVAAEQKHNLGELMKLQTLHSVETYIATMLSTLSDYFQRQRKKKSTQMISKVMDLTETRFNEPLNVQYVAECMHLSPNYFSTMFKQETGINYMDYLTKRRLE